MSSTAGVHKGETEMRSKQIHEQLNGRTLDIEKVENTYATLMKSFISGLYTICSEGSSSSSGGYMRIQSAVSSRTLTETL